MLRIEDFLYSLRPFFTIAGFGLGRRSTWRAAEAARHVREPRLPGSGDLASADDQGQSPLLLETPGFSFEWD
jgi:hypothetical protein